MQTMQDNPPPWQVDGDLPWEFSRTWDNRWVNYRGEFYAHVRPTRMIHLRGDRRARAIIVSRYGRKHRPLTYAAAVVRELLEPERWASYDEVVRAVAPYARGCSVEFVYNAVMEEGALLSVMILVDER